MNISYLFLFRFALNELMDCWFDYSLGQFSSTLLCRRIERIIVLLQQLKEIMQNEKKES